MAVREKWEGWSPGKAGMFWSFVVGIGATLLVGFALFGWTTAGSAQAMADSRFDDGRRELGATVCVVNFMAAPDLRSRLVALQEARSYQRDGILIEAGWLTFGDMETPVEVAADACAERLVAVELPAEDLAASDGEPTEN